VGGQEQDHVDPGGRCVGIVKGRAAGGTVSPLAGTTVDISGWAADHTVLTDENGRYQWWLDVHNSPLTVVVAKDGYRPQSATVKLSKPSVATHNVTLRSL
jgi:hypothetical protein